MDMERLTNLCQWSRQENNLEEHRFRGLSLVLLKLDQLVLGQWLPDLVLPEFQP